MRKKLLLLFVGLGATQTVSVAQTVKIGIKTGLSLSSGVGADVGQSRLRLGGHAGGMARLRLTDRLGVQAEAHYALKGDQSRQYGPSIGHRLAYLDVPVLAQYTLDDLFVEAGPLVSRLLTAQPNAPALGSAGKTPFNPYTYGFAVGFGYQDPSGVQMGWRYSADLTPLYRDVDFSGDVVRTNIRNSALQFYVGALFEPKQVKRASVATGTALWRGSKSLARNSTRLVFITTPTLLFRGGSFLLYRGPRKLLQAIGKIGRAPAAPATPQPAAPAAGTAPAAP
ncbi:porin family protein [Hymenobacter yonginensis]|uniref:Porin family protein n=1 Tax=Hymenobacter yonginensis TaxID=748197 RepID=A0ABY7PK67_9BACT|nr:porin family protein [Hymenobacter yonginensis]WBO83627.1 porin family protein [Hymenobacter yonginensis]